MLGQVSDLLPDFTSTIFSLTDVRPEDTVTFYISSLPFDTAGNVTFGLNGTNVIELR